jgi:hypothetical protein
MRPSPFRKFRRAGPGSPLRNVSRRRFFGVSAGVAGSVLGSGVWTPARGEDEHDEHRRCPEQNAILHINAGPPAGIGGFRFFFPGPIDGSPATTDPEPAAAHAAGRDPSLIFDFDGVVGQADLVLTGTGTDTTTGATGRYGFHTDMRFMAGTFVGTEGRAHRGTFAFIWLDSLLVPDPTAPGASPLGPHSYDPGVSESDVMWTTEIPDGSVEVDLKEEEASLRVKNVLVFDAFTVPNSLNTFHPMGKVPSVINSLRMEWRGTTHRRSHTDCVDAFRGAFLENTATIEVVATTPPTPAKACPPTPAGHGFRFVSDPAHTSISHFAQIGRERNGVFF